LSDIVWLVSYPKSGNTWLRVFLANLMTPSSAPVDINAMAVTDFAAGRNVFDDFVGVEASDLTQDEIERYRPELFRRLAQSSVRRMFVKTHDAYTLGPDGNAIFPADVSLGAIYVVRNPLDIAVSYAHHSRRSIDSMIDVMADDEATAAGGEDQLYEQLRQRHGSWSGHVLSWTDQTSMPTAVLRYEDMIADPVRAFTAAARFARVEADEQAIATAVESSSFERLQAQERSQGFSELFAGSGPFFRTGRVGSWRETLSDVQVERIVSRHRDAMRRFGYLSGSGDIVV
jgi:aryl sulfotransferase